MRNFILSLISSILLIVDCAPSIEIFDNNNFHIDIDSRGLVSRLKRFHIDYKNQIHRNITYRITKYTKQIPSIEVDRTIHQAFQSYANIVNLTFRQLNPNFEADIDIRFERGEHGHLEPFDGPSLVLAHACPEFIHFDDDENWRDLAFLLTVAMHEIGHSLGLGHSENEEALLSHNYVKDMNILHEDDIRGIHAIYKKPVDKSNLNLCQDPKFDTIFSLDNGKTYLFKGNYFYEIRSRSIVSGPTLINSMWRELPGFIDAGFFQNGKTFFFRDGYYWRFSGVKLDESYPKRIREPMGEVADYLDDAMYWNVDKKVYFFKNDFYWKIEDFNESQRMEISKRLVSTDWKGIPDNIDAVYTDPTDHITYFFKDDKFYIYNTNSTVAAVGVKTTSTWFNCK